MTPTEYVEVVAVETARYDVSIRVAQTHTGDRGDWIRCVNAWDYELQRRGIHDLH